jgi:integrase/recombinase XerD
LSLFGYKEQSIINLQEATDAFYDSMTGVLSPATILFYRNRLPSLVKALGKDIDPASVTIVHLNRWRATLFERDTRYSNHPNHPRQEGGLSPFTVHQYVRCARRLFKWMFEARMIPDSPAKTLVLPKLPPYKPRGIPAIDRDRILYAVADNPRNYAIVLFFSETACRVGGLSWLLMDELDIEGGRATVHEKGRGGRNKDRTVFFTEETKRALFKWLQIRPDFPDCPYVFIGAHHGKWGRIHENGIYQMLRRVAGRIGIERNFNPHSFRHGAIRGLLANGISLPEASQIAGHSSTAVTGDIYGCVDENELARRHAQFSWMRREKANEVE